MPSPKGFQLTAKVITKAKPTIGEDIGTSYSCWLLLDVHSIVDAAALLAALSRQCLIPGDPQDFERNTNKHQHLHP